MNKIRASKCIIRDVKRAEELAFLNANHYQGYVSSTWCKGLYYNDELVCLMSFGLPRFTNKYDWELLRLCTKNNFQVYGGASKLLSDFRSNNIGSIISYCNRDKFSGTVYKALGFRLVRTTKGYHYEKDGKVFTRYQFQRKHCIKLWPQYANTSATESQIMKEQGYTRVDDIIGQEAWILDTQLCKWYIYEITVADYHYIGQHKYTDKTDDNYFGSGTLIRKIQNKYGKGTKTILLDNIGTQEEADKYEECAIRQCKLIYGEFYKHNGKCLNIRNNGQGSFGITYGTLGKKACISPEGKNHFLPEKDIPDGWIIGSWTKGIKKSADERELCRQRAIAAHQNPNNYKNEIWNKGKKMPENMNKKGIIDGSARRKAKVNSMIPEGWVRLKEAADKLGLCRQTVLKRFESRILYEGKQKVTIVKLE